MSRSLETQSSGSRRPAGCQRELSEVSDFAIPDADAALQDGELLIEVVLCPGEEVPDVLPAPQCNFGSHLGGKRKIGCRDSVKSAETRIVLRPGERRLLALFQSVIWPIAPCGTPTPYTPYLSTGKKKGVRHRNERPSPTRNKRVSYYALPNKNQPIPGTTILTLSRSEPLGLDGDSAE